jgi:phenylacetate-coenzyme A ligase PaaK-like adenylate-forming protein
MNVHYSTDSEPYAAAPSPDDPAWDRLTETERRRRLVTLAGEQLDHLTDRVAYFRREPQYRRLDVGALDDLDPTSDGVPIQTDERVVRAAETDLVPDDAQWFTNYGTGGTSGQHKNVLDSRASWYTSIRRMANTTERMAAETPALDSLSARTAYNTYNGNHVTSEILNRVVYEGGGRAYQRKLGQTADEMLAEMADLGVDMLICPGQNPQSDKGGSLENLLRIDGEDGYVVNEVERVWYSSTPVAEDDLELLRANDVAVESWYGNTEVRAFGYAPPQHPGHPHVIEGQYVVNGFDKDDTTLRRSGEDLLLLVSAVAEATADGTVGPHTGTGFFNYLTGVRTTINPAGDCPYHDDCPLRTRTIDMDSHHRLERGADADLGCEVEIAGGDG